MHSQNPHGKVVCEGELGSHKFEQYDSCDYRAKCQEEIDLQAFVLKSIFCFIFFTSYWIIPIKNGNKQDRSLHIYRNLKVHMLNIYVHSGVELYISIKPDKC